MQYKYLPVYSDLSSVKRLDGSVERHQKRLATLLEDLVQSKSCIYHGYSTVDLTKEIIAGDHDHLVPDAPSWTATPPEHYIIVLTIALCCESACVRVRPVLRLSSHRPSLSGLSGPTRSLTGLGGSRDPNGRPILAISFRPHLAPGTCPGDNRRRFMP